MTSPLATLDHLVAEGIQFELEHGERAAIVGDNGQGKLRYCEHWFIH